MPREMPRLFVGCVTRPERFSHRAQITPPRNTPGVGNGMGPWFWCVPRRSDLRAVRESLGPRHTPYEEA
ncbi:MAG: hypothetical protein ACK5AM_07400, partial [Pirellulaceae bacterium]